MENPVSSISDVFAQLGNQIRNNRQRSRLLIGCLGDDSTSRILLRLLLGQPAEEVNKAVGLAR